MTTPKPSESYRNFWCECGQKMRVPLKRLGLRGKCPNCGRTVIPTHNNTTEPGEGPPTPAPREKHLHVFKELDPIPDDRTPPPEPPPARPPVAGVTPKPAETFPIRHEALLEERAKQRDLSLPEEENRAVACCKEAEQHETIHTQSLRRLLQQLKEKREQLYIRLGEMVMQYREELSHDPRIMETMNAISQFSRKIKKYEDVLREVEAASNNDLKVDDE